MLSMSHCDISEQHALQVARRALMPAAAFVEAASACGAMLHDGQPLGSAPALVGVAIAAALVLPANKLHGAGSAITLEARVSSQGGSAGIFSAGAARMQQHFSAQYSRLWPGQYGAQAVALSLTTRKYSKQSYSLQTTCLPLGTDA